MNIDDQKCVVCEANFRASFMEGNKCRICAATYPEANSKTDVIKKNKNVADLLSESRVEQIVYKILEEAGLKRIKCDKCHNLFYRTSPAQKNCSKCKVDKETN